MSPNTPFGFGGHLHATVANSAQNITGSLILFVRQHLPRLWHAAVQPPGGFRGRRRERSGAPLFPYCACAQMDVDNNTLHILPVGLLLGWTVQRRFPQVMCVCLCLCVCGIVRWRCASLDAVRLGDSKEVFVNGCGCWPDGCQALTVPALFGSSSWFLCGMVPLRNRDPICPPPWHVEASPRAQGCRTTSRLPWTTPPLLHIQVPYR